MRRMELQCCKSAQLPSDYVCWEARESQKGVSVFRWKHYCCLREQEFSVKPYAGGRFRLTPLLRQTHDLRTIEVAIGTFVRDMILLFQLKDLVYCGQRQKKQVRKFDATNPYRPFKNIKSCSTPQLSLLTAHMEVVNYLEVTVKRKEWDKSRCVQDCFHFSFSKYIFVRTCSFMQGSFLPYLSLNNVV